jgi:hypothetical protein
VPWKERALLADDATIVPRDVGGTEGRKKIDGNGTTSCPPGPPFFGLADADSM